ncbi:MAG TPA: GNAT family N-acetyltransferase [Chroococcidiopsis sp.]
MSISPWVVREAIATDLPAIMQLLALKAAFDGAPESLQATPEQLARDLFGPSPRCAVLLVESDGQAIGFATYHSIYSTFLAKPGLWLDDLFIKEGYRHQGIGRSLMARLCEIAQRLGCARIDWTVDVVNHSGIQFYQSIGATVSDQVKLCRLNQQAIAAAS